MTPKRSFGSSAGFTYIAVLAAVVILGIMSAQAALVWKTTVQREREVELIFRGTQIRNAMQRFYYGKVIARGAPLPPQPLPNRNLRELKDLVQDPGSTEKVRYLRPGNLVDPITQKEWGLVKDANQKIIGVASTSEAAPIKQANFPLELEPSDFEGKSKYSEWQFIYNRVPKLGGTGGGITGLGGSSRPGGINGSGGGSVPGENRVPGQTGAPGDGSSTGSAP